MRKVFKGIGAVFILSFAACDLSEKAEEYHLVWADAETYAEFEADFPHVSIADHIYIKYEVSSEDFDESALPQEEAHTWSKDDIYNWLRRRGFLDGAAKELRAWLLRVPHGFIMVRHEDMVYIMAW